MRTESIIAIGLYTIFAFFVLMSWLQIPKYWTEHVPILLMGASATVLITGKLENELN